MSATILDELPALTARQAYLALLEFLREEMQWADSDGRINLRALLAEMAPESTGSTSDPGAALTFHDSVRRGLSPAYESAWRR